MSTENTNDINDPSSNEIPEVSNSDIHNSSSEMYDALQETIFGNPDGDDIQEGTDDAGTPPANDHEEDPEVLDEETPDDTDNTPTNNSDSDDDTELDLDNELKSLGLNQDKTPEELAKEKEDAETKALLEAESPSKSAKATENWKLLQTKLGNALKEKEDSTLKLQEKIKELEEVKSNYENLKSNPIQEGSKEYKELTYLRRQLAKKSVDSLPEYVDKFKKPAVNTAQKVVALLNAAADEGRLSLTTKQKDKSGVEKTYKYDLNEGVILKNYAGLRASINDPVYARLTDTEKKQIVTYCDELTQTKLNADNWSKAYIAAAENQETEEIRKAEEESSARQAEEAEKAKGMAEKLNNGVAYLKNTYGGRKWWSAVENPQTEEDKAHNNHLNNAKVLLSKLATAAVLLDKHKDAVQGTMPDGSKVDLGTPSYEELGEVFDAYLKAPKLARALDLAQKKVKELESRFAKFQKSRRTSSSGSASTSSKSGNTQGSDGADFLTLLQEEINSR